MKMLFLGITLIFFFCFPENIVATEASLSSGPKEVLPPYRYPFIVLIGKTNRDRPICTGTLISKRFVVTAAQCFVESEEKFKSLTNDHGFIQPNISEEYTVGLRVHHIRSPGALISAEEIKLHPDYKINKFDYDIALIKLSVALEFSDNISPMCLRDMPANHIFRSGTIIGFGTLQRGRVARGLMEDVAPIWSNSDCNRTWVAIVPLSNITPDKICVGGNGSSTCFVISGGPLFATFDEKYYFLGFALYGNPQCAVEIPDVYLRIPPLIDWIKQNSDYSGEQCAVPSIENS